MKKEVLSHHVPLQDGRGSLRTPQTFPHHSQPQPRLPHFLLSHFFSLASSFTVYAQVKKYQDAKYTAQGKKVEKAVIDSIKNTKVRNGESGDGWMEKGNLCEDRRAGRRFSLRLQRRPARSLTLASR